MVVLAATAGLAVGSAISWRGLVGLAIVAGVALGGTLVAWALVMPERVAPPIPAEDLSVVC
jgi:hypothetical protein